MAEGRWEIAICPLATAKRTVNITLVASETAALRQVAAAHGILISGESFAEIAAVQKQAFAVLAGLLTGREKPLRYVTRLAASLPVTK